MSPKYAPLTILSLIHIYFFTRKNLRILYLILLVTFKITITSVGGDNGQCNL